MSSTNSFLKVALSGLVVLALVAAGFFVGRQDSSQGFARPAWAGMPGFDNAARGKSLSMATGFVDNGVEALYGLDHLTGDLFCWVLNTRTGDVANRFRVSAGQALGITGEADYVLSTGLMNFVGASEGNVRPAQSVVYVGDGNSGKIVGFALMYNRAAIQKGDALNAGEFRQIATMLTRDINRIRDQGK